MARLRAGLTAAPGRLALAACVIGAAILAGCPAPETTTQPAVVGPTSRPATRPAPLPTKALLRLDQLEPVIPSLPSPAGADKLPPRAAKALGEAQGLIDRARYAEAVNLLVRRALGFAPNSPRVHRTLAFAYTRLPNPGKALVHFRKAVELGRDDLQSHVMLAQLYAAQKQHDKAVVHLRTALVCSQAVPENPLTGEALFRLGRLLTDRGHWTAALECLTRLNEYVDAHGRKYASRPALRQIVLRPQRLFMMRGELLLRLQKPSEAAVPLRRAYHRERSNANLAGLLVEALTSGRQFKEAEALLADLAAQPTLRANAPALAASVCQAAGDKSMPLRLWRACEAKRATSGELAVALAQAAQKLGDTEGAARILHSVVARDPGNLAVTRFLIGVQARAGKAHEALRLLAKLLTADPGQADIVVPELEKLRAAGLDKGFAKEFSDRIAAAKPADRPAMHFLAGRLADLQGDRARATEHYEKAIAADKDRKFLLPYETLAEIYAAAKQNDKLATLLKQLEELPGNDFLLHYARGRIHLGRGDAEAAILSLRKALVINRRHSQAWSTLGEALSLSGQARTAARAYETALLLANVEHQKKHLRTRIFEAHMDAKAYGKARAVAEAIISRDPRDPRGKIMLAKALVLSGQAAQARKLLAELKTGARKTAEVRLLAVRADLAEKPAVMFKRDFDRAVRELRELSPRGPEEWAEDIARLLAKVFEQNGVYLRAVEMYDTLLKRGFDPIARKARVTNLIKAGKHEPAAAALEELLTAVPTDTWARSRLIDALKRCGNHDKAAAFLRKWLSKATDAKKALRLRYDLLKTCEEGKAYGQAQTVLDDWLVVDGGLRRAALMTEKVRLFTEAQQHDKAVACARKWLKDSPRELGANGALIQALLGAKAYDEAHNLLNTWIGQQLDLKPKPPGPGPVVAITSGPVSPQQAYVNMVMLQRLKVHAYAQAKKWAPARKFVLTSLKKFPENLELRASLLDELMLAKRYDDALAITDKWLKELTTAPASRPASAPATRPETAPAPKPARPDWHGRTVAMYRRAAMRILMQHKKYQQALDRADRYLKQDADNDDLLNLRATCLGELGKPKKAVADLQKVLKLTPESPLANNNLGYQLANMGLQLNRAEQMIRLALSRAAQLGMTRGSLAYLDSLGWALYKQGKLHRAGKVFLEVVRRGRRDDYKHPIMFDHAGDVLYRLGWTQRASDLWAEAVKLAKDEKWDSREVNQIRAGTPGKITAAKTGKPAEVAPLGKGIKPQGK